MPKSKLITHLNIALRADPARVVIRPFVPADDDPVLGSSGPTRSQRIADRILGLDDTALAAETARVVSDLSERHRDVGKILTRRVHEVNGLRIDHCEVEPNKATLIGAFFSEEYSFEAAALFNPSVVAHSDQSGVPAGSMRFVLSLRAVGEGHVSSITFRTGICGEDGRFRF